MITDTELLFSDAQAIPNGTAVLSTNVYDTGPIGIPSMLGGAGTVPTSMTNAGLNLGSGDPLYGFILVEAQGGTTPTALITFESSAAAAMTSSTVHWTSGTLAAADYAVGTLLKFVLPPSAAYLQYISFRYDLGGTSPTATVTAGLSRDVSVWEQHASGLNFT